MVGCIGVGMAQNANDNLEKGQTVEIVGEQSHHNLAATWEVLTETDDGYRIKADEASYTLTVTEKEIKRVEPCDNCGSMTDNYQEVTGPELNMTVPLCEECSE